MLSLDWLTPEHKRILVYSALLAGVWCLFALSRLGMRPKNYPPGPPTLPIIGNLHQIPDQNIHLQYQKWAKQYGPIFSLKLGQQTVVVLADGKSIQRLVDKRSANYADRQQLYIREQWDDSRIIMRGYDDVWKVERRLYHSFLNVNVAKKYLPYQELETTQLCMDMWRDPANFVQNISRTTISLSTSMTYGFRCPTYNNPIVGELFSNAHAFFTLVDQSKLLDWYPSLKMVFRHLPIWVNSVARKSKKIYSKESALFHKLFDRARDADANGSQIPCFAADLANAQVEWKGTNNGDILTDHAASYIAGTSFEAGADTTKNTLVGFVKAMALFPEVQEQAHKELDSVVGNETMPILAHRSELPYIEQVVKESLRWMPTAVNGAIPHAALKNDEVDGYHIPAGAGVVLAVWSANNDPSLFEEPRAFNPSRHRTDVTLAESMTASDVNQHVTWGFGAGRRICPGMHVAHSSLYLALSRLLWAFKISPATDESGKSIYIHPDEVNGKGLAAMPLPFKCKIELRDEKRGAVLEKSWAEFKSVLTEDGELITNILSAKR